MRGITKDFECNKRYLLSEMTYFEKYVQESTSLDEIDISVHCDIKIFTWLMKYLQKRQVKADVRARYAALHGNSPEAKNPLQARKAHLPQQLQGLMTPLEVQIYQEPQLSAGSS